MKFVASLLCLFVLQSSALGQRLPRFQVEAKKLKTKTAAQEEKMRRALAVFEKVMNDELFQKELLDQPNFYSDSDKDPYRGWTTQRVVEKIYEAAEAYDNYLPDNIADINWVVKKRDFLYRMIFDRDCSTIGFFDYKKDDAIITYTCFFDDEEQKLSRIVGHVAHEWTHALGFVHKFDNHPKRDETVPYAFGDLVEEHAKRIQP